jgi:lipoprotein-anchoring transpeptidase ErfK/SrfK
MPMGDWLRRGSLTRVLAVAAVAALGLAGCGSHPAGVRGGASASPTVSKAPAAQIFVDPVAGSAAVRLDKQVSVRVTGGRLTSVQLSSPGRDPLDGEMSADSSSWQLTQPLGSGRDYTLVATASSTDGQVSSTTSTFSTLTPKKRVKATIQPGDGWKVGVGMPVIVHFDRSVTDRDAVEEALSVTSKPSVEGAWRWQSSTEVQWRPRNYWPSGTKVSVDARLTGVEAAKGVWGTSSTSSDFTIGNSMISTVDVAAHKLTVRRNGKVIRTIPVTTGKSGFETRNGIKVIITRETSRRMDAATTGTDPKDPNYYNVVVKYAMRLTWSGEFLHAAPWSVYAQGHSNVSHGCTGMSTANALWLFEHSKVGDVVIYRNSHRSLEWGNGYTAWDMPFSTWASGN